MKTVCRVCRQEKDITCFGRSSKHLSGINTICKDCDNLRKRRKRVADPDAVRQAERDYYAAHLEKRRAVKGAWVNGNIDDLRRRRKERDARNAKEKLEKSRAWKAANPERVKMYHASYAMRCTDKRRARHKVERAVEWGRIKPARMYRCAVCNDAQAVEYHHHNGYSEEHYLDVIPVCKKCHTAAHVRE